MEAFLQRLIDYATCRFSDLDNQPLFTYKKIKDIDKSPCESLELLVIDYDETKRKVCQLIGIQEKKSCDALFIWPKLNRIDFIEFKSLQKLRDYELSKIHGDSEKKKRFLVKKMDDFGIQTKLNDSYFILQYILARKDFGIKKTETAALEKTIEQRYFLLVDLELTENSLYSFGLMTELLASDEGLQNSLIQTTVESYLDHKTYNFITQKPRLISCKGLFTEYSSLLRECN